MRIPLGRDFVPHFLVVGVAGAASAERHAASAPREGEIISTMIFIQRVQQNALFANRKRNNGEIHFN